MKLLTMMLLTSACMVRAVSGGVVLFHDDFKGKLGEGWSWVREHTNTWRVSERGLEVLIEPGNMWGPQNNARNVLVRPAPDILKDEIEVSVLVENRPTNQYEQVDLVWYYDDSNMVKIGEELVDGKLSVVMGREENDKTRTIAIIPLDSTSVRLRFFARENRIRGQFSTTGGKEWRDAGECTLPAPTGSSAKISLQFYQGAPNVEHWGRVTEFNIQRSQPSVFKDRKEQPANVRVAGVVIKWVRGDKEANYRRVEPLIREAAAHGAQIVCTTECFLDGYAIADKTTPLEQYRALGEPIPEGPYFRKLTELAKELKIVLIAGLLEADGEARYNTAVSINANGELIGKYHKQQLDHESARNPAGSESSVINTELVKLGVMICADRRIPEIVKGFSDKGAEFLICPSGGMFGDKSNDPIVQARSKETHKYIVFVHPAEFLVTAPDGTIVTRTVLGNKLAISPDEIGSESDLRRVFYVELPKAER